VNKLPGVPKLTSGTKENTAVAVYTIYHVVIYWAQNWQSGACILLEQKLGRALLYLGCRHHIIALILAAIFKAVVG